jgi:hypothetical protein
MERFYENGMYDKGEVNLFVGDEIEHTLAHGTRTLFLARNDLTTDQILELVVANDCEHIYYGANRMYMHSHGMQIAQMMKFLDDGYYVTVDYPYAIHTEVKKKFALIWKRPKFIPFCSIIFPNTAEDPQVHIKIDDVDFNKTNPGVWAMSLNKVKEMAGYTQWEEYKSDRPIDITGIFYQKEKNDA